LFNGYFSSFLKTIYLYNICNIILIMSDLIDYTKIVSSLIILTLGLMVLPLVRTLLNVADFTINTSATEQVDLNFFKVLILLVYISSLVITSSLLFISVFNKN